MQKLLKIDNIMYKVADLDKAAKLYIEALGLKQLWRDDKAQMIGLGWEKNQPEIVIHTRKDLPSFDFSYAVNNVPELVEQVKSLGFKIVLEPIDVRIGKYAVLEDPDGNKFQIIDLTKFGGVPQFN